MSLTAKQEKMEAEMNRLLSQLETEKSRYKKMERDLQKELSIVFDENSKLTTLLDGKVPQSNFTCCVFLKYDMRFEGVLCV